MAISTKESWLEGPGDLREDVVEDVPVKGQSVRVRGLSAAFSNQASSEGLEIHLNERGQQTTKADSAAVQVLQFHHGVIEPKFTLDETKKIAEKYGTAFIRVIEKIDELSGVDTKAVEKADATFPSDGAGKTGPAVESGASPGDSRPLVSTRAGA